MTNKQKLNKLCNIRTDLGDDSSSITSINRSIQSVADDFISLIKMPSSYGVRSRIESLKEPYQGSDSYIRNAKSYCQYEINRVCRAIEEENSK